MTASPSPHMDGDACIALLGRAFDAPELRSALSALDIPWHPQLTRERPMDWIRDGALELGFEDRGVFEGSLAQVPQAAPVLQQVCFYVPRAGGPKLPVPLPLGLVEDMTRAQARHLLAPRALAMRGGDRDAFDVQGASQAITVVLGYRDADRLDSVLALVPRPARAPVARGPNGFGEVAALFGREWHDPVLFSQLYAASDDRDSALSQIKRHGTFDLVRERGLRLLYRHHDARWTLAGCEIYRARVRDAATWQGALPFDIRFQDRPEDISARLRRQPDRVIPGDLQSSHTWVLPELQLVVVHDRIVNLVASTIVALKPYFES